MAILLRFTKHHRFYAINLANSHIPFLAFVVSYIFNRHVKSRFMPWWAKYNYVLSAALDSSVAISAIVIFFCVVFPGAELNWWGNTVNSGTIDGMGTVSYTHLTLPTKRIV